MNQQQYKRINTIVGWCMFLFSSTVYWLTAEPTGSFWDCGEFLPSADKLQIAHSPGSPLFLMIGHMWMSMTSDVSKKAVMFNHWSGFAVALAATFLFWIITHLAKKLIIKKDEDYTIGNIIAVMGAGAVGAAAFTFCDSMWFSAVEAIVFATSALFTSLAFWSIIKWDNESTQDYADRWLIFAGFIIGLSVGVHLLSLLTIPAIVFTVYFKNFKTSRIGVVKTFLVAAAITGLVQYALIQGLPKIAAHFDVLFVNSFGMPFNTGVIFFFILVFGFIAYTLLATQGKIKSKNVQLVAVAFIITYLSLYIIENALTGLLVGLVLSAVVVFVLSGQKKTQFISNHQLNTVILTFAFMIIGYTSYMEVLIRASANPPVNMSNPNNVFDLVGYLGREQYGTQPFLYGPYFTAKVTAIDSGSMQYHKGDKKYETLGRKIEPVYDKDDETIFPRLWDSEDGEKVKYYKSYLKSMDPDYKDDETPTFGQNLSFFFGYQIYYMYWRYFLWDFSGRQNDRQGDGSGDYRNGNWQTGITFIDNAMLGPQDKLPPSFNNRADTKFYMLPFILGLFGMFYQFKKSKKDGTVVLILFFMTGLGILLWLNQPPLQPRERDYSYIGSFYAYCIWIGLGVLSIYEYLKQRISPSGAATASLAICSLAPVLMGSQGWPSHDRSNRYTARDFGENYLQSCKPDAILFTQGDNDTYPLWYAQEVEGVRNDVRVVNLSLLGVDWYINEMRYKANNAPAIKLSLTPDKIESDRRDITRFYDNGKPQNKYFDIKDVVNFIGSDDASKKVELQDGEMTNYLPVKLFSIGVDRKQVIANGTVDANDTDKIVDAIRWKLNKGDLLKNDLMTLDIIASNAWDRPIYFAISVSSDAYLGMEDYLQQEGLTYRLVPIKKPINDGQPGFVDADRMYDVMMHKFKWGGIDKYNVYLDENILRMVSNLRSNFARLAATLAEEGKKDSAMQVLDLSMKVLPERNVPYSYLMMPIAEDYYRIGAPEKANPIVKKLLKMYDENLTYFLSLDPKYQSSYMRDAQEGLYVIQELYRTTQQFGQKDLNDQVKVIMNKYRSLYGSSMGQG